MSNTNRFFIMTQREIAIQKIERTIGVLEEFKPNETFDKNEDMTIEGSAYLVVIMDLSKILNKLYEGMEDKT